MAKLSKTITLTNSETQTLSYDLQTDTFELSVGHRDPIVWSDADATRTSEIMEAIRQLARGYMSLRDM